MVEVMFLLLDARHIPYNGDTWSQDVEAPCAALTFIGSTFYIWLSNDSMASGLIAGFLSHWGNIRRWIIYLHTACIKAESLDISIRLDCKAAVVSFLALTRDRLLVGWSKKVIADTKIMPLIFELWKLETLDVRFSSYTGRSRADRESAILNACFMMAHETNTSIDWGHALRPFDGQSSHVSRTALSHLAQEMARNNLDPECIAWDVHIITAISFRDDMRESLFRLGAITTHTNLIHLIVGRSFHSSDLTFAARCISNASLFLRGRLQESDGIPWISEALRADIIMALVKCQRFIPFMDSDQAREAPSDLLHSILPAYTAYRSLMLPISKAVDAVKHLGLEKRLDTKGKLYAGWQCLHETTQRRRVLKCDGPHQAHVQTCHNENCRKTLPTGTLRRCGGCLHTYYCSKSCQRYDWRRGKHKAYCIRIQGRPTRSLGEMRAISNRDLKFLDRVIEDELLKHRPRIASHGLKINVVELDITRGEPNITFDSRGIQQSPFKLLCRCEHYMDEKWKSMRQHAIRTDEPIVLVRVFISGGIARKVVLRAIPLFKVLGNPVKQSAVFATYVYTCCGRPGLEINNQSPLKV
ncbi:hypothetical protein K503DRAFT_466745 [Rhizopogon vinicolor AM-OR11-026]|uniref:MYND-type domain-containing protein n=1 Tax=Rhizopogon vinicolor AM-OR11-026 TaxID=1314800 RepID=A0A1B7NA09_9AGAM|nr:hypothetical protein K503DRAFT_466745 [Rhizopogon vinicolor AM-OR11-026]